MGVGVRIEEYISFRLTAGCLLLTLSFSFYYFVAVASRLMRFSGPPLDVVLQGTQG